ncbi:type 1 glutamine amidotransferase domain-containing protein [Chitinophaga tropicalis]|uniref:Type 1 glutamine amidotransferase domain-containing protein n=1 Tax=Chitinophaga tropicalis TaxID=2683588 RepID=A0A7K1U1B3_9BACT|nr:type 1 glutamine amidotransferase domain-containing protein [Chitinophaga tropicalis]MVT07805.1 type 1 glutamine amidotransferase domain-containing protein [Chitinophaga tropicalis]
MITKIKYALVLLILTTLQVFGQTTKKVLIVVTSFGEVKNVGKTGLWAEELATPYYLLTEKGVQVTIASPKGGKSPIDPKSLGEQFATPSVKKFMADAAAQHKLNNTVALGKVKAQDYDAVFYPGGHGPMWDLTDDARSIALIRTFSEQGKPVALVCHAPAILKNVKDKKGEYLVKGKTVSGFTNSEEKAGGAPALTPFSLEDMLKERGAKYERGADWAPFAVQDGLLITGQNPASAELVAEKIITALSVK